MKKYTDCYVAFLDILGFKNIIGKSSFDEVNSLFIEIQQFKPHPLISAYAYKEIKYYIMSDSIIVYIDSSISGSFMALCDVCAQIQMMLIRREKPILLRGGIAKGDLFCENNLIFGNGLVKAYTLESSLAIYPRIIFTGETYRYGMEDDNKLLVFDYNNMFYQLDTDKFYYIDYLNTFNYIPTLKPTTVDESNKNDVDFFEKTYSYVNEFLEKCTDKSLREKYLWLQNKICEQIERMPSVNEYFQKQINKEDDNKRERYNRFFTQTGENDV